MLKKGVTWKENSLTMSFTNNHASFHLRWKKNLIKPQEDSKYHDYDSSKNMALLAKYLTRQCPFARLDSSCR